jgi:hypothetical protein
MTQIKKEQLKKFISKDIIDILSEVEENEAYFNHISYEHVLKTLIKEWAAPGSAGNWNDVRTRAGLERLYGPQVFQGGGPPPGPSPEGAPEPSPVSTGLEVAESEGPVQDLGLEPALKRIVQNSDPTFAKNIINVGNDVYFNLDEDIQGKTPLQLGELTLAIIQTVVDALDATGTGGRRWAPKTAAPAREAVDV